ncbi:TlpA family protein disulfide reductase [Natronorubrum sulfidifaciens]|uniref:Alkyl hydroperoxide reductase/ Thiol specific antioxidant/ Mal allergen n=1 Tax=Natronorubrum sulfidifaciens JCM 14089 TaxID=1230460 RepID=L9W228_9EURY|nr:redoxin domain-containing protein [Natronorubrum sulfidifaciens]ELY43356.1 alkyl hydroperoxide reductase/ Thiol specific antioxidant/ Mal allergen [Natronorubrum sulfidifaciens JCM 14089]
MNRRELIAGIASVGVLGGAGAVLTGGLPSFGDGGPETEHDESDRNPLEVETIDAEGSEDGTFTVPTDGVTTIMFFTTGCGNCQAQMPRLADAREELVDDHGDRVQFLSATYQTPETLPEADLHEWWTTHSGNWHVGYDSGLASTYSVVGFPVTIVVDTDGEKHWEETGVQSADRIVGAVESVLETETFDDAADDTSSPEQEA